jgi:hypothetical protein
LSAERVYLGDGLYAEDDLFQIKLIAPRGPDGDHVVYLDASTLAAFLEYVEKVRRVRITVAQAEQA